MIQEVNQSKMMKKSQKLKENQQFQNQELAMKRHNLMEKLDQQKNKKLVRMYPNSAQQK